MKVCDVVKDSIWYDPRVKKQIESYLSHEHELFCVGVVEPRYKKEEVEKLPCYVHLVANNESSYLPNSNFFSKIKREVLTNIGMYREIVKVKPDIIHANDLNALIPACFASRRCKCKLIYDTHEIFLENPWIVERPIAKWIWGFFERHLIHKADAVVCVSHAAADYLQKKYSLSEPIVVTNCIGKEHQLAGSSEQHYPLEVLNHGQFYRGRGYDIMVEAAPLLKDMEDVRLVLRGFGVLEEQLRKRVAELNADNVSFAQPVKVDELIPYASHAYVGLAITEAISINFQLSVSNKLFEYAAAGLPVIMSNIPEHRYLNDLYHFGLILEEDTPQCLAKAVRRLVGDKELYASCKENALRMSSEINWENEFDKLLSFEKALVEEM